MTLNKSFLLSFCCIIKGLISISTFSRNVVIHSDTIPDKPFDDFKTGAVKRKTMRTLQAVVLLSLRLRHDSKQVASAKV